MNKEKITQRIFMALKSMVISRKQPAYVFGTLLISILLPQLL